jgi:diguanylate cyclase
MQAVLHLVDSTAIMAGLAVMFGTVRRHVASRLLREVLLGTGFGLGAVASMLQPVLVIGDVIIDCRVLFTGFAGAFLGPVGATIALVVASLGRLAIHVSPAAVIGILCMATATCMGRLWRGMPPREGALVQRLALLGGLVSLSFLTYFLHADWKQLPLYSFGLLSVYNVVGAVVLGAFLQRERAQAAREANAVMAATTDPLTGLLNRRGFSARFREVEAAMPSRGSAMLLVDLDHFKKVNDSFGHLAGDMILRQIGERIRTSVRPQDLVLRAGGEEFAVLLTDVDQESARDLAARIQGVVGAPCELPDKRTVKVTASIGGFCWTTGALSEELATDAADRALYAAKAQGRDRAIFAGRSAA